VTVVKVVQLINAVMARHVNSRTMPNVMISHIHVVQTVNSNQKERYVESRWGYVIMPNLVRVIMGFVQRMRMYRMERLVRFLDKRIRNVRLVYVRVGMFSILQLFNH
jgi:hypothetical protein